MKQTLYIIFIVALFNFILINIFRLQKEITAIRNKTDKVKAYVKSDNYKNLNSDTDGFDTSKVKELMNNIADLVPVDFNKISESKSKFIPKYEQI